jgi:hypothetical protein
MCFSSISARQLLLNSSRLNHIVIVNHEDENPLQGHISASLPCLQCRLYAALVLCVECADAKVARKKAGQLEHSALNKMQQLGSFPNGDVKSENKWKKFPISLGWLSLIHVIVA